MNVSRTNLWLLASLLMLLAALWQHPVAAAPPEDSADVVVSDDTQFTIPEGDAQTVLNYIEKIANPSHQFANDEELKKYLDGVSTAIGEAADKVLAGEATDRQLIDAIEWKMESLRIREKLGDADAQKKSDEFLANLKLDSKPAVAKAVQEMQQNRIAMQQQMELMTKLRQWGALTPEQRNETADWLISAVKSDKPTMAHAGMLMMFVDTLSNTPDAELAKRVLAESLPALKASGNPEIDDKLPMLEGISRRLNLLGNSMEVEGTFLDGTKIDWASYRGKVVLVDYWATWCGPCRAEVPNVLQNYFKYHDKGFEVVGISLDDKRSDAEEYVKQTNIPWPSLFHESSDESGWQNPMAVRYGITGIPTAILIDQQGKVVSMQARGPRLAALLEKLLGTPADGNAAAVEVSDKGE